MSRPWNPVLGLLLAATLLGVALTRLAAQTPDIERFTDLHADFGIEYRPTEHETNRLAIILHDEDAGQSYAPGEAILVVRESAKLTLPGGTPFGNEGDSMWILPQSQDPSLLYLGFSAEGIHPGAFQGPLRLRLIAVSGPGDFFTWQANEFGALSVLMNSRDGIDGNDETRPIPGSHGHLNWGFTRSGRYEITFQAEGTERGSGIQLVSAPARYVWEVEPIPQTPATPPRLGPPVRQPDGTMRLSLFGQAGTTYTLEATQDFKVWETVARITATDAETKVTLPAMAAAASWRFFRASSP